MPLKLQYSICGITKLPALYAKSEAGKTLMTVYEIMGDMFRSVTGLKDGARTASGWTKCVPTNVGRANARTASEQAIAEATARWKKKQEQEGYHLKDSDIDEGAGFVEPMLAYPMAGRELPKNIMLDRKYNGMRMITTAQGGFSRKGKTIITVPHILYALKPLFHKFPNLVLDGEAYNHEYRYHLNDMLSVMKRTKPSADDLKKSEQIVRYYVYDGYGFGDITEQTGNADRRVALHHLLKGIDYAIPVEGFFVKTEETLRKHYESFVADGYEGAIIRNADAPYQHKRTKDLLKLKPEDDAEGKILVVHEGNGAWRGCAKTATVQWGKIVFDATFKCSQEEAKKILDGAGRWMGKKVTFKYNGLTGKGVPNYAQIDPDNCEAAH